MSTITKRFDSECTVYFKYYFCYHFRQMHAVFRCFPKQNHSYEPQTCDCNVTCKLVVGFMQEISNSKKTDESWRKMLVMPMVCDGFLSDEEYTVQMYVIHHNYCVICGKTLIPNLPPSK